MKALTMLLLIALAAPTHAANISLEEIATYKRDAFSREVTECDRLASHPDDPERVTKGVPRPDVDLEAAIKACTEAVKADPANPRLNYQLGRAYGYSGRHAESDDYRETALKAGYPQSLFVLGYIRFSGWDGRPADACYGGALIKKSAEAGRLAGLVAFPHYFLNDKFADCEDLAETKTQDMVGYLERAKESEPDFYQGMLIEKLLEDLVVSE